MVEGWLVEFAKGIGRFFLNPVFYFMLVLAFTAGVWRIKRERRDFNVRVHDQFHELKHLLPAGLIVGFILSIAALSTGFTLPLAIITVIAVMTILLGIVGNARFLSPALTIGFPLVFFYIAQYFSLEVPLIDVTFPDLKYALTGVALLIGILLLSEGLLMSRNGLKDVSPKLRKSRRGLIIGAHQTKRFWLLPASLFLPAGPLTAPFEWWPVFEFGSGSYSLILVPFVIGFQHQIQSVLPKLAVDRIAKQVLFLGILITAIAAAGFWLPDIMPIVAGVVAILGRLWISYRHRVREGLTPYYFTPRNSGIMILNIIPDSPADRMGLKTGEIITTCNNIEVRSKRDLYESLLKNRAYCKLEVFDVNNQNRLIQGALYEGDHHELGILFIEKRLAPHSDAAV